jgi:ribosomal protein S18 acetylase RimI-like enzyme
VTKEGASLMSGTIEHPQAYTITEVDHHDYAIAQQIHTVQVAAYTMESLLIGYPNLPPLLESIEDIQTSGERFLACWWADKLMGALSFERQRNVVEICRLVVAPEATRRGIGSRLLLFLEQSEVGCQLLRVSTAERNVPAVKLYEKQGYRIQNRRQLPDGLRLVELAKESGSD